jgi:SAM-dependent methyltransferase
MSRGPDLDALAEDARLRFESLYEREAPWDVPGPQEAIVKLAAAGAIRGRVLDAGCGTGENALYLGSLGLEVFGIDISPSAIGMAREKARARGFPVARLLVADALRLEQLGMPFDTVVDSGLLHAMTDAEREVYVLQLGRVVRAAGLVHVLCFSDQEPGEDGPRRIAPAELREAFSAGWTVIAIEPARFRTRARTAGARAWLASVRRPGG